MARAAADLTAVQAYLRVAAATHREVVRSGPFRLHVDGISASPGLNYAIPDDGTVPSPADVAALTAAFAARELTPALEFLPALSPACESALTGPGGLAVAARIPLMTGPAAALVDVPPPGDVAITTADARTAPAVLSRIVALQAEAFGAPVRTVEKAEVERLRRTARDGVVAFAYSGGEIIAGGVALVIHGGLTELAGVAVAAEHRRRGIAAALTAVLAREAVARGAERPFLTAADEPASRVYARAGFTVAGEMLHLRGAGSVS